MAHPSSLPVESTDGLDTVRTVNAIRNHHLIRQLAANPLVAHRSLDGLKIAFTGRLGLHWRSQVVHLARLCGAVVSQDIDWEVSFLVVGDKPNGAKLLLAEDSCVDMLIAEKFFNILRTGELPPDVERDPAHSRTAARRQAEGVTADDSDPTSSMDEWSDDEDAVETDSDEETDLHGGHPSKRPRIASANLSDCAVESVSAQGMAMLTQKVRPHNHLVVSSSKPRSTTPSSSSPPTHPPSIKSVSSLPLNPIYHDARGNFAVQSADGTQAIVNSLRLQCASAYFNSLITLQQDSLPRRAGDELPVLRLSASSVIVGHLLRFALDSQPTRRGLSLKDMSTIIVTAVSCQAFAAATAALSHIVHEVAQQPCIVFALAAVCRHIDIARFALQLFGETTMENGVVVLRTDPMQPSRSLAELDDSVRQTVPLMARIRFYELQDRVLKDSGGSNWKQAWINASSSYSFE